MRPGEVATTAILGCLIIGFVAIVWCLTVGALLIWMALYTLQPRH